MKNPASMMWLRKKALMLNPVVPVRAMVGLGSLLDSLTTIVRNKNHPNHLLDSLVRRHSHPRLREEPDQSLPRPQSAQEDFNRRRDHASHHVVVEGFFSGSFCSIFSLKKLGLMLGFTFSSEPISRPEDPNHVETIHGIKREDALSGLQAYNEIAATARKVSFEVLDERDLAKPSRAVVKATQDGKDRLLVKPPPSLGTHPPPN